MLRRLKSEVQLVNAEKTEHVLFVKMTPEQEKVYKKFINSDKVLSRDKNRKDWESSLQGFLIMVRDISVFIPRFERDERRDKMLRRAAKVAIDRKSPLLHRGRRRKGFRRGCVPRDSENVALG